MRHRAGWLFERTVFQWTASFSVVAWGGRAFCEKFFSRLTVIVTFPRYVNRDGLEWFSYIVAARVSYVRRILIVCYVPTNCMFCILVFRVSTKWLPSTSGCASLKSRARFCRVITGRDPCQVQSRNRLSADLQVSWFSPLPHYDVTASRYVIAGSARKRFENVQNVTEGKVEIARPFFFSPTEKNRLLDYTWNEILRPRKIPKAVAQIEFIRCNAVNEVL